MPICSSTASAMPRTSIAGSVICSTSSFARSKTCGTRASASSRS
jgi:hypothetical protein